MSVYKQFLPNDYAVVPFNAHKQYNFDSSSALLNKITFSNLKIIKNILKNIVPYKIHIELPNDLKIMNKKVCGILQEIIYYNEIKFLIIGVGINIKSSPTIKEYETTYINKYNNKINKSKIINFIKNNFEKKYSYYA